MRKEARTYEEAIAFLEELPLFTKKNDPANTVHLLRLLGHPEEHYGVIHVAGTNGKGSTCAFLESIFRGTGLRTGLFTSPHLVRINERIRTGGIEIPDDGFLKCFLRVRNAARRLAAEGGQEPTYFETLFAMGMCWFEECGIDLLICETGLGGRLDPTNTIQKADAVVITSVSLDHTKYLGDTVEEIAYEKAGIIREKTPVIYLADDPRSAEVIAEDARRKGAEQIPLREEDYDITGRGPGFISVRLSLPERGTLSFNIPFTAQYQAENACLAALCAFRMGVDPGRIRSGIENTRWSGRMEEIRKDVYLDGAHNPDGIRHLASEIRLVAKESSVRLLAAIVSDKNHQEMVRELCKDVKYDSVIVTSVSGGRQLPAGVLAEEFRKAGQIHVVSEPSAEKAYLRALREKGDSVLFCVGSLYLIGEILGLESSD